MRFIFAIVAGALVGSLILFLTGFIANAIRPTPPELMDPKTPEAVALRVASTSMFSWLSTIFGLALGSFVGGMVGAKISREKDTSVTGVIGLVLSLWAAYTFYIVFPDVLWVPLAMLIAVFLFSYIGGVWMNKMMKNSLSNK